MTNDIRKESEQQNLSPYFPQLKENLIESKVNDEQLRIDNSLTETNKRTKRSSKPLKSSKRVSKTVAEKKSRQDESQLVFPSWQE